MTLAVSQKSLENLKKGRPFTSETGREAGKIGIPCIVDEEGKVSLTWEEYM